MDRNKVESILLKIGIPINVIGFDYIVDAMEVFEENGFRVSVTGFLYPEIAKRNSSTASRVERNIRHAFEIANSTRGDSDSYDKYIGLSNTTNSAALISLYKHIKVDCKDPEKAECSAGISGITPDMERAIREIVRGELKRMISA